MFPDKKDQVRGHALRPLTKYLMFGHRRNTGLLELAKQTIQKKGIRHELRSLTNTHSDPMKETLDYWN